MQFGGVIESEWTRMNRVCKRKAKEEGIELRKRPYKNLVARQLEQELGLCFRGGVGWPEELNDTICQDNQLGLPDAQHASLQLQLITSHFMACTVISHGKPATTAQSAPGQLWSVLVTNVHPVQTLLADS